MNAKAEIGQFHFGPQLIEVSRYLWICCLLIAICTIMCRPLLAAEVAGIPTIIDGDTLKFSDLIVRLHGIDAAETGQSCIGLDKKTTRPADLAFEFLKEEVAHGITCRGDTYDDYGRLIAVCYDSLGNDIDKAMVRQGLAWAFVKYSDDYLPDESVARQQRLGVWSMVCENPWDFRAKRWTFAIQKAPDGCPIKGNISDNGKIYHVPWSRHYSRTKVDITKGERWFCSEKEADQAGWRAPLQ